jgi:hypothetical protein
MPHGSVFKVRKDLRNALRSLRDAKSECYVWVDAICINQSSNAERNHQGKLMAVAWLESAGEHANVKKAFEFIRHYGASPKLIRKSGREDFFAVIDLCNLRYWSSK